MVWVYIILVVITFALPYWAAGPARGSGSGSGSHPDSDKTIYPHTPG